MKKNEKEYTALMYEDSHYRKNQKKVWHDKLDFSLGDMENFWDDIYGREDQINQPKTQ